MLKIGDKTPNFSLLDEQGVKRKLSDHFGKKTVVYFCYKTIFKTCEYIALDFKDNYDYFLANNVVLYCITSESEEVNFEFKEKHQLPFNLLSDINQEVALKFGAFAERKALEQTVLAPINCLFIIDEQGQLLKSWLATAKTKNSTEVINYLKTIK